MKFLKPTQTNRSYRSLNDRRENLMIKKKNFDSSYVFRFLESKPIY